MCKYTLLFFLCAIALSGCTPAQNSGGTIEWVVANQTPDTLRVLVRYPLDSVLVPLAEVAARRHSLGVDSAAHPGFHQLLGQLTSHRGQWYWVRNSVGGIATWATCDAPSLKDARPQLPDGHAPYTAPLSSPGGLLTYQLPPHCTQLLVTTPFVPDASWPQPPIIGLQLKHGSLRQVVLPGRPLQQVFRPQPTGREHDYSAQYRYQLTVGPGLTIND